MNDLKQAILSLPLVQRIHELEGYIDSNKKLNESIKQLKDLQKQMVHAKEYHQPNQYQEYKKEYDSLYNEILDIPFIEEYLDLLDEANQLLLDIANHIQTKINHVL